LGETLEGFYNDGSKIYAEQISHHPPISYVFMEGMNKAYKFHGYYNVEASAGLNSVTIVNKGKRKVIFKDGQTIDAGFYMVTHIYIQDIYKGTFLGTTR
jgi:Oxysterol-binding protein